MLNYDSRLKPKSRNLRSNMTDAEQFLWARVRRKQILDVQFYRQKPIGKFIVDFYAPRASLVVELDGGQHFEPEQQQYDQRRSAFLAQQGLTVLRFTNLDVFKNIEGVMEMIFCEVQSKLDCFENPPCPSATAPGVALPPASMQSSFSKGGEDHQILSVSKEGEEHDASDSTAKKKQEE